MIYTYLTWTFLTVIEHSIEFYTMFRYLTLYTIYIYNTHVVVFVVVIRYLKNVLNPGVTSLDWKRSSGWLESCEGLLFATDVLTTCAEAIFRVTWRTWLWRWLPHRLSKRQWQTKVLPRTPITQMIFLNQSYSVLLSRSCHGHFEKLLHEVKRNFTERGHKQELHLFLVILRALE